MRWTSEGSRRRRGLRPVHPGRLQAIPPKHMCKARIHWIPWAGGPWARESRTRVPDARQRPAPSGLPRPVRTPGHVAGRSPYCIAIGPTRMSPFPARKRRGVHRQRRDSGGRRVGRSMKILRALQRSCRGFGHPATQRKRPLPKLMHAMPRVVSDYACPPLNIAGHPQSLFIPRAQSGRRAAAT